MNTSQFFISFTISNQRFAVPLKYTKEIVDSLSITKIPMTSSFVEGIANYRGEIIPVLNLYVLIKKKKINTKHKFLILEINNKIIGLTISSSEEILGISPEEIEQKSENELISGIFHKNENVYFILNTKKLIEKLSSKNLKKKSTKPFVKKEQTEQITEKKDYFKILTFKLNNNLYAFQLKDVEEIINYREINFAPNLPSYVEGIIKNRNYLSPVINTKSLLEFNNTEYLTNSKIIFLKLNNSLVGTLVDSVENILNVDKQDILNTPFSTEKNSELKGIIEINGKLIMLIDILSYLKEDLLFLEKEFKKEQTLKKPKKQLQYVIIKLNNDIFAISVENILEIFSSNNITKIPNSKSSFEGLLNYRGNIIPVVNLRKKLTNTSSKQKNYKFLICKINDQQIALLVDEVIDTRSYYEEQIRDIPELGRKSNKIKKAIKDSTNTILILEIDKLLTSKEKINIEELSKEKDTSSLSQETIVPKKSKEKKKKSNIKLKRLK